MSQSRNGMTRCLSLISLACVILVGCKPSGQVGGNPVEEKQGQRKTPSLSASTPPSSVQSNVTAVQWTNAVNQAFDKVNVKRLRDTGNPAYVTDDGKTDENGVTEFFVCFDKSPPKCELSASGKRDGFRKILFFTDPQMEFDEHHFVVNRKPSVRAYISLRDCDRPAIVLESTFRSNSWLFLEKFGLMLDGSIVINRKFDFNQVNRENSHNEISESVHMILDQEEVNALRRVTQSKQVLIRLTGQKRYVGIDREGTENFVRGTAGLLRIHDALGEAIEKVGQVKDDACPS